MNDTEALTAIRDRVEEARRSRRIWEVDAYENMLFLQGQEQAFYNTKTGRVETKILPAGDQQTKVSVKLARTKIRSLKNTVAKNPPAWTVANSEEVNATEDEKDTAQQLLQTNYRKLKMPEKIKTAIDYGFIRSWAVFMTSWDTKKNRPRLDVWDPLDSFPDPCGSNPEEWDYFVGVLPRTKRKLLAAYPDKKEIIEKLTMDGRKSESHLKHQYEATKGAVPQDSILLRQGFFRETDDSGKCRVRIVVEAGGHILRNEIFGEYEHLGQFLSIYFAEKRAGELYPVPWMTDVVSLNKLLNRNFANIEEYDRIMVKGRYLKHAGAKLSHISTEKHGQIVQYTGMQPSALAVPPLPGTTFEYQDRIVRFMEDIAGVHGESMGRQSGSAESGVALSILVGKDADNASEPATNMEETLQSIAENILLLYSWHYKPGKIYLDDDDAEEPKELKVVGDAVKNLGEKDKDSVRIKAFQDIQVTIIPGSALADIYALETAINLRQNAQVKIPDSYLIHLAKIGSARHMLRKYEKEQEEANKKTPDVLIAEGRLKKMIAEGIPQEPAEGDNLEVHLALAGQVLASLGEQHPAAPLIQNYMMICEQFLQAGGVPQQGQEMMPPQPEAMPV